MGSNKLFLATCLAIAMAMPLLISAYEPVAFATPTATLQSYRVFLRALKKQLRSGDFTYDIPMLREPSKATNAKRHLLVDLKSLVASVTIVIDVTDASVVGYKVGSKSYFVKDVVSHNVLFKGIRHNMLGFGRGFAELERMAGVTREHIQLGILPLQSAIDALQVSILDQKLVARSLIVVSVMICEGAKFRYIEHHVRQSIGSKKIFFPDPTMLSFQNQWWKLSESIQKSNQGVFPSPVELIRRDKSVFKIDYYGSLTNANLAFMPFICRKPSMLVLGEVDTCAAAEPLVYITGRDGLCVDVKDTIYTNGQPIIMWNCKMKERHNQEWVLKKDGTIRSGGKCMTTKGFTPGSGLMIYDCDKAPLMGANKFEILPEIFIVNSESRLSLTDTTAIPGNTITLEDDNTQLGQGWRASIFVEPSVTAIAGVSGDCIEADGIRENAKLWLKACVVGKAEQQWMIYPDDSIRPQKNKDLCITINDKNEKEIFVRRCKLGWAGQRWVFNYEGIIKSGYKPVVLDVKPSSPQLVVSPFTSRLGPEWLPLL